MKKSLEMLRLGMESSSGKTLEFKAFVTQYKKDIKTELKNIGATDVKFRVGHFEVSGNFTIGTQCYYFSTSDVRNPNISQLMYRTCTDYKDYSGGYNQWVKWTEGLFNRCK